MKVAKYAPLQEFCVYRISLKSCLGEILFQGPVQQHFEGSDNLRFGKISRKYGISVKEKAFYVYTSIYI